MTEEMLKDLEELRKLHSVAERRCVQTILSDAVHRLEAEVSKEAKRSVQNGSDESTHRAPNMPVKPAVVGTPMPTCKIATYAWDQSEKFVKIYLTVPGADALTNDMVTFNAKTRAMHITISGAQGKNYEWSVADLLFAIIPANSTFKLKKDCVLVMLKKEKEGQSWAHLTELEHRAADKKAFKTKPDSDKNADPQDGIMSMMKQLYDEGDDDMKRTLKRAWFEAQSKRHGGGGGSDFGEF